MAAVVLVVDDDVLVRTIVTRLLQRDGHLVLSAADGREALELARKHDGAIHLVITDYNMPHLNGGELCAHLIEERPGIKALVMSGTDVGDIVSQTANVRFLPKPFDCEKLRRHVDEIIAVAA